ncbi:LysR family transcriptional regulator [Microlunatus sp. Gsoil 973]|uniref:LysR family transcriptional regulator n=1 Tax=Microlunatus sp. Gsoil 973 TaxID=2672569 RepID=UPI0018A836FF|nr:LysR family transcriptional regulator [Microlunatus sp. Gsoil 973]
MHHLSEQLAQLRVDRFRSLVAVARHGSFSAAAEALRLSQPRVSTHVADLERVFRTTLFDRSCKPIALTESGRRLTDYARRIVDILDEAQHTVDVPSGRLAGAVVVGMYPSAAAAIFPQLLADLAVDHPGLQVSLWEGATLELDGALLSGDIDLAVRATVPAPEARTRFSAIPLWSEPLVAVVRPDDELVGGAEDGRLRLGDLDGRELITIGNPAVPSRGTGSYESQLAFAGAGLQPTITQQTNQPQTLLALVAAGVGVGVTNWLAVRTADDLGLRAFTIVGDACRREVSIWWRTSSPLGPIHHAVIDRCRRLGKRLAAESPPTDHRHPQPQ